MVNWPDEPISGPAADDVQAWTRRLDAAAGLNAMRLNPVPGRREVEPWLRAWHSGSAEGGREAPISAPPPETRQPDVRIWRALVLNAPAPTDLFNTNPDTLGPILASRDAMSLEGWTESDLCALHAVWHLATRDRRTDWGRRCVLAALWHAQYHQPDTATIVPWALHVFVIGGQLLARAGDERAPALTLHAETLLHNAVVGVTRPDSLSSMVLADAAAALRSEL